MPNPCGWTITKCACGTCWDTYSPSVRATAAALATGIMWAATARRYGQCTVVVQPCRKPTQLRDYQTYPVDSLGYGGPYMYNGQWYNGCGGEEDSCCKGCELGLEGPTTTAGITEVLVNGVALPASSYQVMNKSILVRTDGECWPVCTNYSAQNPPSLQVEYLRGEPIPDMVQAATERLACEFAKACVGSACGLPLNMRSMTRQGVEMSTEDMQRMSDLPHGIRTGIKEVDLVIAADNPTGRMTPPTVWSPDSLPPRVLS